MRINEIFKFFVVKEKKFYPNMIRQSELAVEAAKLLVQMASSQVLEERIKIAHEIKNCETQADAIQDILEKDLYESFVTPFNRNDMHTFTATMDDFIDFINDSAKKIVTYQPKRIDRPVVEITECILQNAQNLLAINRKLEFASKNYSFLLEKCDEIRELEHHVDDLFENYLNYLFNSETDPIEIIKYKGIIIGVEETIDKAKEASKIMRTIINLL
jgi:Phosphate transport regulator (distant homolog of PhoU)